MRLRHDNCSGEGAVVDKGLRLAAVAVVVLVGAGACALESQSGQAGGDAQSVSAGQGATGASASPGPSASPTTPPSSPSASPTVKPTPTTTTKAPKPKTTTTPGCPQGENQREVETALAKLGTFGAVTVDGRQSAADCAAIKKFQQRYGIRPAAGRAGPTTADVAKRLAATDTSKCKTGSGTTFCVDLTHQTVFAIQGGKVVLGPTVTRTGMPGYATPTGAYSVRNKALKEWSNPYEVWLPYWQRFNGGIGFHETTTYIHTKSIGSHGCINLLPSDARAFYKLGKVGTRVYVFGHRQGT
ncbi:L,D-transpeptidase family protein [Phytohabitans kaempferiae]|uniref:L,D-transpeptidase family protein n=1 Tax=Phytohabitans kaempferiae TaxID=1620943 RepID=A0ABV6LWS6_9ACTN